MTLDFFLAKQKHKLWLIKVRAYLLNIQSFNLNEAISHTDCELGKWIYNFGFETYKDIDEMVELEEIHLNLHAIVRQIIELKNDNKIEEAFVKFEELKRVSNAIIYLLNKLEEHIDLSSDLF